MTTDEFTNLRFVAPKKKEINPDDLNIVQATQVSDVLYKLKCRNIPIHRVARSMDEVVNILLIFSSRLLQYNT